MKGGAVPEGAWFVPKVGRARGNFRDPSGGAVPPLAWGRSSICIPLSNAPRFLGRDVGS